MMRWRKVKLFRKVHPTLKSRMVVPYSDSVTIPFSGRLDWPAPENPLAVLRSKLRDEGQDILDFSESNPTRVGLGESVADVLVDPANDRHEPDPRGLSEARRALAEDYASRLGSRAPRLQDFFLCASTSEGYSWLFKLLCDPGDAVLVPKPGYPLFDYLAGLEAVEARPYRLEYAHPGGWRVDIDSLTAALRAGRARALVLINPNNPTGSYIHASERRAIVDLCASLGCAIIADEVFYGFPVEAGERSSFIGESGALCFVLDGLSKRLGLPQMKMGWIAASGPKLELEEAEGRLEIIADAYLSAGTPIMNALPRLLGSAGRFGERTQSRLVANLATLRSILEGPGSPHRVLRCEGGWTAIVESPRLLSEDELAKSLLRDAGLWSYPGYFFDMEREAFFTVGLILRPELLERGACAYRAVFERLMRV
jgi:aspartate/methionine/tyrosine aminotransferase